MSENNIAQSEKEYYRELRGSKSGLDRNTWIWILAFFVSSAMMVLGIVDWFADYESILTNQSYTNTYTSSNGDVETRTYQPIFGRVNVRRAEGGFLPDWIGLTVHEFIIIGFILFIAIPSILIYQREGRRLAAIDDNLPYLLREVADSQRIGMQLPRAIGEAAKRNYGPLTPELKKLAAKISWGIPFREAMMSFREALDTPLSRQATILILEAERSGGELEKIFDSAKDYTEELLGIKQEREASIKPYIYIVFISYIIFAIVIFVLFTTFFAPFGVQEITTNTGQEIVPVPLNAFKSIFLYLLITQAFFSGLVAGKMGHGEIKMGMSYSTILMIIGLLVYKFLIIPSVDGIVAEATG